MDIAIKPGEIINNEQLTSIFLCAPQGGMRRSHRTNTLVLISDKTGLYKDRVEGDVFHYTGMGQVGDQTLTSQNKTLAESNHNAVDMHFFEVLKPKQYTYQGRVELAGKPYTEKQIDINGKMRNVWIFPLRLIHGDMELIQEIENLTGELNADQILDETEKERIVKTRIGQSLFKQKLLSQSKQCALCGVNDERFLIASHIKPWSISTNEERLDVNNGLLLCPNHDSLFDKGYISFDEKGSLQVGDDLNDTVLIFMNINPNIRLKMNERQKGYIYWHYHNRFKSKKILGAIWCK
ncbi:HNH endonuclease [Neobacillus massiliamazoniensis]|uniref:Restriction endonuclease-like protein n=1 Tax=Neobacillus massiliamazoniensis TaxID=1499688 RepID=A0A0U1NYD1_9BACI|nr:HNH endonuclease [Neobacillus massiliamazoniensis]CRK83003.1 restriction endonuclease-like protein [Neobacillus massiliamazoniensis]